MRAVVDEDECCGAGQCVLVVPDAFDQRDEDGLVVLLDAEPPEREHAAVREAAGVCPAAAIELDENAPADVLVSGAAAAGAACSGVISRSTAGTRTPTRCSRPPRLPIWPLWTVT